MVLLKEGCAASKGCDTVVRRMAGMDGSFHRNNNKQGGWEGCLLLFQRFQYVSEGFSSVSSPFTHIT